MRPFTFGLSPAGAAKRIGHGPNRSRKLPAAGAVKRIGDCKRDRGGGLPAVR